MKKNDKISYPTHLFIHFIVLDTETAIEFSYFSFNFLRNITAEFSCTKKNCSIHFHILWATGILEHLYTIIDSRQNIQHVSIIFWSTLQV